MQFWEKLFSGREFMPRRSCGLWDAGLINLHVVSDVVIWLSYLWIPLVMLWSYYAHRKGLRLHGATYAIFLLYIVFITACGWTHFFDALMFYNPVYRLNGVVRAITAVASLATAVSLVRLVPLAVTAPVTILAQQAELHRQHAWLRDILDGVTDGKLRLVEAADDLPSPLGGAPAEVRVDGSDDLRAVRNTLREVGSAAGFERFRTDDLLTSVNEAAMNALVHAGGALIRVYHTSDRVQVWVRDGGQGIPLDRLPISTLKQGFSTAGTAGQGWIMILAFVDRVHLLTGSHGTTVVLEAHKTPARPVPFSDAVGGDVPT